MELTLTNHWTDAFAQPEAAHSAHLSAYDFSAGARVAGPTSERPSRVSAAEAVTQNPLFLAKRAIRSMGPLMAALIVGVAGTLTWQSLAGSAGQRQPGLKTDAPALRADLTRELDGVKRELAASRKRLGELAANQEQLGQRLAKLQLAEQDTLTKLSGAAARTPDTPLTPIILGAPPRLLGTLPASSLTGALPAGMFQ